MKQSMPQTAAVLVAAGSGRRMGGVRKPFLELAGEPVLRWAIRPFLEHASITTVVVVLPEEIATDPPAWLRDPRIKRVTGGAERSDSVRNGLAALPESTRFVLIHDAARPFVSSVLIDEVLRTAVEHGAAIAAVPVTDTLKRVDGEGRIQGTVDREGLWRAQTPQGFDLDRLRDAYAQADHEGFRATDDAALLERYGMEVRVVRGSDDNLKITHPTDLDLAEALARRPTAGGPPLPHQTST